jgi:hypothetical protein
MLFPLMNAGGSYGIEKVSSVEYRHSAYGQPPA